MLTIEMCRWNFDHDFNNQDLFFFKKNSFNFLQLEFKVDLDGIKVFTRIETKSTLVVVL
jgi:hypothetical protein